MKHRPCHLPWKAVVVAIGLLKVGPCAHAEETHQNWQIPILSSTTLSGYLDTSVGLVLPSFPPPPPGDLVLPLAVQAGFGYLVESSTDLAHWTPVDHVFAATSVLLLTDTNSAATQARFFRGRQLSNDLFADRFVIDQFPATILGSTVGAAAEPGEPSLGFGQSIWWTWTAPVSTQVGICMAGTDFGAQVGVYTGDSVTNLIPVALDPLSYAFQATAGTTYQFQFDPSPRFIGAEPPPQGPMEFTIAPPPPNDDFANRITLTGNAVEADMPAFLATVEPFESTDYPHSIWWSWTAPTNGSFLLTPDCQNYGFPPEILAGHVNVYTGTTTNDLTAVGGIFQLFAGTTFDATTGTTYQIAQNSHSPGNYTLSLKFHAGRYSVWVPTQSSSLGSVSLDPQPDADGLYVSGTQVTATATVVPGHLFAGWTGSITNSSPNITFTVDHSYALIANFGP